MARRLILIAACFAIVIAAIIIVALNWPQLPESTLPKPMPITR